jgi:hypothetical protein
MRDIILNHYNRLYSYQPGYSELENVHLIVTDEITHVQYPGKRSKLHK